MDDVTDDVRRKRLVHRSRYRGFLESDLVFRKVAHELLPGLDAADLARYEALLEETDDDLWAWVTRRRAVPVRHDHALMARLQVMLGTHEWPLER
jgi:antitoxin CptB